MKDKIMFYILGIDPGQFESAYIVLLIKDNKFIIDDKNYLKNSVMLKRIISHHIKYGNLLETAIETIVSYGMKIGQSTLDTAIWAGRFFQLSKDMKGGKPNFIERPEVKLNICHSKRAKDKNIKQAIKDRFGEIGTVKNPGRLYNIRGNIPKNSLQHIWSSFAVAITYYDNKYGELK